MKILIRIAALLLLPALTGLQACSEEPSAKGEEQPVAEVVKETPAVEVVKETTVKEVVEAAEEAATVEEVVEEAPASEGSGKNHTVKVLNVGADGPMVFEPGYLKVAPGDSVTFEHVDLQHDSVSVVTPEGAESWSSGMSTPLTVTLDKEGVYIYKCTPHLIMAMVGVIQVGEASNLEQAKQEADKLAAGFAMNKDRLSKYMAQVN